MRSGWFFGMEKKWLSRKGRRGGWDVLEGLDW